MISMEALTEARLKRFNGKWNGIFDGALGNYNLYETQHEWLQDINKLILVLRESSFRSGSEMETLSRGSCGLSLTVGNLLEYHQFMLNRFLISYIISLYQLMYIYI